MSDDAHAPVLPLSGKIETTPLTDVLETLRQRKATGTLTLRRGNGEKTIYLRDGRIVFAASADEEDKLGALLVKRGKLTRAQLEQATRLIAQSGGLRKLGAVLAEQGLVPPRELFSGQKTLVKEIIAGLFLWNDGTYVFRENLPPGIIQIPIDFEELIAGIIETMKQDH